MTAEDEGPNDLASMPCRPSLGHGLGALGDQLMVVRVGAPSDNELRIMRPSVISGTKARVTGDDDFVNQSL
jgi:hypothetical protein